MRIIGIWQFVAISVCYNAVMLALGEQFLVILFMGLFKNNICRIIHF